MICIGIELVDETSPDLNGDSCSDHMAKSGLKYAYMAAPGTYESQPPESSKVDSIEQENNSTTQAPSNPVPDNSDESLDDLMSQLKAL